jgi:protein involved in temperature-dependent protein secretion
METVIVAIEAGDYARAFDELQYTGEARTKVGIASGAFLLAMVERFDEAEALLQGAQLPSIELMVRGERQRAARWRDPKECGFSAATPIEAAPLYAAMAAALAGRDEGLADRTKQELAARSRPIGGRLTLANGEVRTFANITDTDDAIGQMLETYCGNGLLYFPFEGLRRIEVLPKTNFMDHLVPKVKLTGAQGSGTVLVPLLYANSTTSSVTELRNGLGTFFDYVGQARRGRGHRDFMVDNALVGLGNIASIEFVPTASA